MFRAKRRSGHDQRQPADRVLQPDRRGQRGLGSGGVPHQDERTWSAVCRHPIRHRRPQGVDVRWGSMSPPRKKPRQVEDDAEDPTLRQVVDGRPEVLRKTQSRDEHGTRGVREQPTLGDPMREQGVNEVLLRPGPGIDCLERAHALILRPATGRTGTGVTAAASRPVPPDAHAPVRAGGAAGPVTGAAGVRLARMARAAARGTRCGSR
jgi:hypothetical protein